MSVEYYSFPSQIAQLEWLSKQVKSSLDSGVLPSEIAVIARSHKSLEQVAKVFGFMEIAFAYERGRNVLEQKHIVQLITISRFIASLNQENNLEMQELLPEILSYDFWEIDELEIYKVSLRAYQEKKQWLEIMLDCENPKVVLVAKLLLRWAKLVKNETAETVLDEIMGANETLSENTQEEDDRTQIEATKTEISPFKRYYFDQNWSKNQPKYYDLLSSLRVFVQAIRTYKQGSTISLLDMLDMVGILQENNFPLIDNSMFNNQQKCVNLLTSHKAKGLEFEQVFVINCQENEWNKKRKRTVLDLPNNLPLLAQADMDDDNLRLFYVALTRAKRQLFMSGFTHSDTGKELVPLSFLQSINLAESEKNTLENSENRSILEIWWKEDINKTFLKITPDIKDLLQPVLQDYKLSVTHLTNFLDVSAGGPLAFLENNLLRFPQSKSVSGSYGSAMHYTLSESYIYFISHSTLPSLDYILTKYEYYLKYARLNNKDFVDFLEQGRANLTVYYTQKMSNWQLGGRPEFDFAKQGVLLNQAHITGKIDRIDINDENQQILVIDYKTGKIAKSWQGKDDYEKIKLWKYKMQLVFYKLLVENSRDFAGKYTVQRGALEFLEVKETGLVQNLELEIQDEEVEQLAKLVQIIYDKIVKLDFPDISKYSKDLAGIENFMQDLLV